MCSEPVALELAELRRGDCGLVDVSLDAGADVQAWVKVYEGIPDGPSPLYLLTTTPLHVAIKRGDIPMIKHLLSKGFSGRVFPSASITACLNPVMATVVLAPSSEMKMAAYEAVSPYADMSLRSKIFDVHILHHAVATLDLDLILKVEVDVPLGSAGTTALGRTLLHIACLPRDQKQLNSISPKINQSIYDLRMLPDALPRLPLPPRRPFHNHQPRIPQQDFLDSLTVEFAAQTEVISYLHLTSSLSGLDVSAQDIHGNTALHYLASYVVPNDEAIALVKKATANVNQEINGQARENGVWSTIQNHGWHTAKDLYTEGQKAVQDWKESGGSSSWKGQIQGQLPPKRHAVSKRTLRSGESEGLKRTRGPGEIEVGSPPGWQMGVPERSMG